MAIMTLSFSSTVNGEAYFRMQLLIIMWGIVVSFEASIAMCIFRHFIQKEIDLREVLLDQVELKTHPTSTGTSGKVQGEQGEQ